MLSLQKGIVEVAVVPRQDKNLGKKVHVVIILDEMKNNGRFKTCLKLQIS